MVVGNFRSNSQVADQKKVFALKHNNEYSDSQTLQSLDVKLPSMINYEQETLLLSPSRHSRRLVKNKEIQ